MCAHTHSHRARWKEMHFSTETNSKALYYFLGSARNVMRKLAEGGKKSSGRAGWDEIWDEAMKQSRHAAIESSELGGHSQIRYCTGKFKKKKKCSVSSAYWYLLKDVQMDIIVISQVWPAASVSINRHVLCLWNPRLETTNTLIPLGRNVGPWLNCNWQMLKMDEISRQEISGEIRGFSCISRWANQIHTYIIWMVHSRRKKWKLYADVTSKQ